jgi:DNA-binding HxlR family transcriptional regulator
MNGEAKMNDFAAAWREIKIFGDQSSLKIIFLLRDNGEMRRASLARASGLSDRQLGRVLHKLCMHGVLAPVSAGRDQASSSRVAYQLSDGSRTLVEALQTLGTWRRSSSAGHEGHSMLERRCERCGKEYLVPSRQPMKRFCSSACRSANWRAVNRHLLTQRNVRGVRDVRRVHAARR